jgi:hypothetical protein
VQFGFDGGELAPAYQDRFDLELVRRGLKEATNVIYTSNGSIRSRYPLKWEVDPLDTWSRVLTNPLPDAKIFRYHAEDSNPFATTDKKSQDYGLVFSDTTARTIRVSKFDPKTSAYNDLAGPQYIKTDYSLVVNDRNVVIDTAQAGNTVFMVSNNFRPHHFVEAQDNISTTTGTVSETQFWKEVPFTVSVKPSTGLSSLNVDYPDSTIDPRDYLGLPTSDLGTIRLMGKEYDIAGYAGGGGSPFRILLSTPAELPAEVNGLRISRRWPVLNTTNANGGSITDDSNSATPGWTAGLANSTDLFRPRLASFYRGRLVLAGSTSEAAGDLYQPTGVWMSSTFDPYVIMPADFYLNLDNDSTDIIPAGAPIQAEFFSTDSERFMWAFEGNRLYFGSEAGVYVLTHPEGQLTSANVGVEKVLDLGIDPQSGFTVRDNTPVFSTRGGRLIGALYDFGTDGYGRADIQGIADHFQGTFKSIAIDEETPSDPVRRLWCVKDDGTLYQATLYADHAAWSKIDPPTGWTYQQVVTLDGKAYFTLHRSLGADSRMGLATFDESSDWALDFQYDQVTTPSATTNISSTDWTFSNGVDVFAVGSVTNGGQDVPIGNYNINDLYSPYEANLGQTVYTLSYGLPYVAKAIPVMAPGEDDRGLSYGRPQRMLSMGLKIRDTSQLLVDQMPVNEEWELVRGENITEHTGHKEVLLLGWRKDWTVNLESRVPYDWQVDTMVQEVSI